MKLYKIRNKKTQEFESFGYDRRQSWRNKPNEHIKHLPKGEYELVIYELIETKTEDI